MLGRSDSIVSDPINEDSASQAHSIQMNRKYSLRFRVDPGCQVEDASQLIEEPICTADCYVCGKIVEFDLESRIAVAEISITKEGEMEIIEDLQSKKMRSLQPFLCQYGGKEVEVRGFILSEREDKECEILELTELTAV